MISEKIIDRVKALLSKTVQNGCSEDEAFAAAKKAQEIMDQYDIDTADLADKSEFVQFIRSGVRNDVMKRRLMVAVTNYCGCYVVTRRSGEAEVTGRDVDIIMAQWLYDALDSFLSRELKAYMSGHHKDPGVEKTNRRNGFIAGACHRISERLEEMKQTRSAQGNELVIARQEESKSAFLALNDGIKLQESRSRAINVSRQSMVDGREVGDKATFSRPICAKDETKLLN